MEAVLLSIQIIVAIAIVALVLLQKSEGGALGIGGGPTGLMTARGAGDFLSKATKWAAVVFIANSLFLGWISTNRSAGANIIDQVEEESIESGGSQLPELPTIPDGSGS